MAFGCWNLLWRLHGQELSKKLDDTAAGQLSGKKDCAICNHEVNIEGLGRQLLLGLGASNEYVVGTAAGPMLG